MTAQPRIAPLKLRFVVVGGSLGGLAVAYSLARSGHSVHVVERKEGLVKVRMHLHSQFATSIRYVLPKINFVSHSNPIAHH